MSTSGQDPSGGYRDPLQMPRKKRGPMIGLVSARAGVGTPGANIVHYDQKHHAFYQDVREQNPLIGTFQNRIGNLIKSTILVDLLDWNHEHVQSVAVLMSSIHNEYRFVYAHPDTGELVSADPIRNEIDMAIIRDAKRMAVARSRDCPRSSSRRFAGVRISLKTKLPKAITRKPG